MIKTWNRQKSELLQSTRILDLFQASDVSPYSGKTHDFVYVDSPDWVNMVPLTSADEVVLIRQYRHGSQAVTLEIPGGMVDPGEDPARAAIRECHEETGFMGESVSSLGKLNPNPALFNNCLHTFYGRVNPGGESSHVSETERTLVELVPVEEVRSLLLDGTIDHTLVCATLWRFLDWWQREGASLSR